MVVGGGQPHAPVASTPGKDPVPVVQEAGCAPGPVRTGEKSRPHRVSIPDVQPVVSRYADWTTRPICLRITSTNCLFENQQLSNVSDGWNFYDRQI